MNNTQLIEYVRRGGAELKIGDRVRILPRHGVQDPHSSPVYVDEMIVYAGQHVTIESVDKELERIRFDEISYNWSPDWVERV